MISNGVDVETMQKWDRMFCERETRPRPIHGIPYELRKRKYARWESRSTTIRGSDTVPHSWNYMAAGRDDEEDEPDEYQDIDTIQNDWCWSQSWSQWTYIDSAGATPATQFRLGTVRRGMFLPPRGLHGEGELTPRRLPTSGFRTPARLIKSAPVRGARMHCAYGCILSTMFDSSL